MHELFATLMQKLNAGVIILTANKLESSAGIFRRPRQSSAAHLLTMALSVLPNLDNATYLSNKLHYLTEQHALWLVTAYFASRAPHVVDGTKRALR